jgi:hypothetical protein
MCAPGRSTYYDSVFYDACYYDTNSKELITTFDFPEGIVDTVGIYVLGGYNKTYRFNFPSTLATFSDCFNFGSDCEFVVYDMSKISTPPILNAMTHY